MARRRPQSASGKRRVIGSLPDEGARNQLTPSPSDCVTVRSLAETSVDSAHRIVQAAEPDEGRLSLQSSATTDEIQISIEPKAWRATRWVGAVAGHATGRDLLAGRWITPDHRNSVTRVYAAACADLAQATLGGLPSCSSTWERWFTDLRSTARDLSPVRGNPYVVQRALFHGVRLEGEHAPWVQQLRRGFSALLAASLPEPLPALIGEDLASFHDVDAAWCAEHTRDAEVVAAVDRPELEARADLSLIDQSRNAAPCYARIETAMWPIARLLPNPLHPRTSLDPGRIQELAASIAAHASQGGILQPLLVTPEGTVVAGHRRLAAARQVGMVEVPVVVRDLSRAQQLELILTDNIQHEDLSPVELSGIAFGTTSGLERGFGLPTVQAMLS
jgi:hypothetical protein